MRGQCSGLFAKSALLGMCGILASTSAHAIRVETSASVTPGLTVTDNVCLTKNNKEWDWIGLATPSASIKAQGKKSSVSVSTSVQLNTLTNSQLEDNGCGGGLGSREKFSPKFRANASTILIDEWLQLGFNAHVDQQEARFSSAGGNDDLDRRGNRNNFYRYSISPTLSHRIGTFAKFNLKYSYDQKFNSEDNIADTTRQLVSLGIDKTTLSDFSLGLSLSHNELDTEDRDDGVQGRQSELQSALMRAGYQINQRWQVNGNAGVDSNTYSSDSRQDQDGPRWDVGLKWSPTPRTSVSLGTGSRYFGQTPRVNISHKRRLSTFTLSYGTSITYERELRDLEQGFLRGFGGSSSLRGDSPIIDERLTLGYIYAGRNATLSIRGSHSEQEREEDGSVAVFDNLGFTYSPVLSTRYTTAFSLNWDEDDPRAPLGQTDFDEDDNSQTWQAALSFGKQLNNRFDLGVSYTFTDRQSERENGEYQENRITATLGIRL